MKFWYMQFLHANTRIWAAACVLMTIWHLHPHDTGDVMQGWHKVTPASYL